MRIARIAIASAALALVQACSHPIEIVGAGDVGSASGTRNCALEEFQGGLNNCRKNLVYAQYQETYIAAPRPGWQFRRWGNYCQKALNNECSFNMPASTVQSFWGATVAPLQAIFRSTSNSGFTLLFIGDSFFDPIAQGIESHAHHAGFGDHASQAFIGANDQGAPLAIWNDTTQRTAIQAVLDTRSIELFGMTYDPGYPTVEGYKKWVDYALKKNPDTRFFIASPWSADPATVSSAAFQAGYQVMHDQVHLLIDNLRAMFPGVDFYCVPSGQAAVDLHAMYSAGNLPGVPLVGNSTAAIFSDSSGQPGDILAALGQLVWLSAIYSVDLSSYDFESSFAADLPALAELILDGHDREYNAPPEVDSDTDGDGIVDRLDPNPGGQPNILLIVADDLGYNDLAINNNNAGIDTPNLDQLAEDGVRFTRHYAATVCSPARAALLTGLAPERLGYLPNGRGISPQVITLPERLRAAGYATWHIGKWHIGDLERRAWPDHQGFDHWFGFLNQDYLAGTHQNGELQLSPSRYTNPWLASDSHPGQTYPGHLETVLTTKAKEVISTLTAAQKPWFLNLWYYAPHAPIQPAAEFAAMYPDTPAGKYQALVNQLDHNIGEVISHLDTLGALDDTIIVVVSDNGGTNAQLDNNAPFYGSKATLHEGGLRTPLIIRWPDDSINGQVISDTVAIQDIFPTLLEAVSIDPPANLDGDSFYASLQQLEPVHQNELFWEAGPYSYGVLTANGRWRYYHTPIYFGFMLDSVMYDFNLDPTATQPVLPIPPAQQAAMMAGYGTWYRDVHTVATNYSPAANGSGILTGMDFLRTPGFGTYTFGIGISHDFEGQIAAQGTVWQLSRSGDTIEAQFGDILLSGEIASPNTCHSIIVSGNFYRRTASWAEPDRINLNLYLDGSLVQTIDVAATLAVSDTTPPTVIGDPQNAGQSGVVLPPIILNTALTATSPWTLASFDQAICAGM